MGFLGPFRGAFRPATESSGGLSGVRGNSRALASVWVWGSQTRLCRAYLGQLGFSMPFIRVVERAWMGGDEAGFSRPYSLLDLIELNRPNVYLWELEFFSLGLI